MDDTLFTFDLFRWHVVVTPWKFLGWLGVAMFGGRWVVQAAASHLAKRPVLPSAFWYMSVLGSGLTLSYFIWGKNDSVGIMSTAFPMFFACYNLYLHYAHKKERVIPPKVDLN
ncbi:MAG: lipid A biosynthesis acyltransferase [Blastochloris sp.]|nr:lipid A biosynthesis acyltransferase [Blastochloris sp.]